MDSNKKIVIGTLILSSFVFVVSIISIYVQTQISSGNACSCFIPLSIFIPFTAAVGLFIGTLVYRLFYPAIKNKVNIKPVLKLLERKERKIFEYLIKENGKTSQAKIVHNTDLSKVQVFRTLKKLKQRGLITKEKYGKTNKIKLNDEIKKIIG